MGHNDLINLRNQLESALRITNIRLSKEIESTCDMCFTTGIGIDELPKGWYWILGTTYKICDKCLIKWQVMFGELPDRTREGELYENSIFSEDITHWRQADFKFI